MYAAAQGVLEGWLTVLHWNVMSAQFEASHLEFHIPMFIFTQPIKFSPLQMSQRHTFEILHSDVHFRTTL